MESGAHETYAYASPILPPAFLKAYISKMVDAITASFHFDIGRRQIRGQQRAIFRHAAREEAEWTEDC